MSNLSFKPEYVWDGKYENFSKLLKALENFCYTHGLKNKIIQPDGSNINLRGIYVLMLMSNCPPKDVDYENGWVMNDILTQNELDRPDSNNPHYRTVLDHFETVVFDNQDQAVVEEFLAEILGHLMVFFEPDIPEIATIDRTDPFCTIRFLQHIYTKYLEYVAAHSADITTNILDRARSWTGGGEDEFRKHIRQLQKLRVELPPQLSPTVTEKTLVDLVIASLRKDSNLESTHAILRFDYSRGACFTLDKVESAVTSVLKDVTMDTKSATREEPVAATAFFSQQKKRNARVTRGKPLRNQSQ